jgi:DNA-binding CsgD family transcriptional regulator
MVGVSVGIPGAGVIRPGTHLCALYSDLTERNRWLFSFLEEGLRAGDRCLCLADDVTPREVREQVTGHARLFPLPGRLDIARISDVCLPDGEFSGERVGAYLRAAAMLSTEGDCPLLRAAGEMSQMLPCIPQPGDFFVYEAAVDEAVDETQSVVMCLYDLHRLGTWTMVDLLRTHAKVLLDRTVLEARHHLSRVPCGAPAASGAGPRPVSGVPHRKPGNPPDRWFTLTGAELRVAALVAGGLSNQAVADQLVMSRHTVDAHLKHTYTKLDIHSRVSLAVLAVQHRGARDA